MSSGVETSATPLPADGSAISDGGGLITTLWQCNLDAFSTDPEFENPKSENLKS